MVLHGCWLEQFLVLSGQNNSPGNFSYGIHDACIVSE
jgi:hypothetical protein